MEKHSNIKNIVIALLTPLPSILFYLSFLHNHSSFPRSNIWSFCYEHPLLLANILFFFNVDLLFWLIGLLLSNNWLIDLYWTVIPVLLVHYFSSHPNSKSNSLRSTIAILLTWVWSIRLTHNYFRREKWEWGKREDWRFSDMRKQYGKNWWWISFFAVYLSQQVFIIGICLPMFAIHASDQPCGIYDLVALVTCITGITVAYFADTQLHEFVTRNETSKKLGMPIIANLETGLWRYSRHPNYFGEQLFWWGLYLFAWNLGYTWMFVGPLVNSMCLGYVTVLVERRMVEKEYRAEAYRQYQKSTSVWIPWFKGSKIDEIKEKSM
ncbi:3-oxo-5-alpha-steroid 4-dehydrogenase (DUF1295) [Rhynchospora pubera]|uniref:3-oxo-5-alpha-steroid 4-dehydrogenase (DUF1295) n=1 Tax=Rhynchospora pubera TaxID=906938 RepID=A0AAV8BY02_9POAL|nr:3-oxo-5-alpha-steroid 4-dehydrogenase (DUF1295) [Rhynchospora pubera]KAJ4800763.1 3-oxo-5-alpha-steroid 4-dehydrogenase (DUF1295) [Rhynchospora pubera]